MVKTKLPEGVTFKGRSDYYDNGSNRSAVDDPFLTLNETREIQRLRKEESVQIRRNRPLKGKAFLQERKPRKLQRVTETIIYDKERIKNMEYQKYMDECQEYLKKNYLNATLSRLIPAAIGINRDWKVNADITEVISNTGQQNGLNRIGSKVTKQNLSFHLSDLWRKKKVAAIFIERDTEGMFSYRLSDMAYRIGPKLLVKFMHEIMPEDGEKLRIRLSEMRQMAKNREDGISEDEFNFFISTRHKEMMNEPVKSRKKQKKTKRLPKVDILADKPCVQNTDTETYNDLVCALSDKTVIEKRTPTEIIADPQPSIDTGTLNAMVQDESEEKKQPVKKIKFNIKIGFIPFSGEIEIS